MLDADKVQQEAGIVQAPHQPHGIDYDPTQGVGTDAWQLSRKHNLEIQARERRN